MEEWGAEIERERVQASRDLHTLDHLLEAYVADRARVGRRQGTVESYQFTRKRLGDFGTEAVEDLSAERIDAFYMELDERYAVNTIRQTHAVLTAALGRAVDWGWIAVNPAKRAAPPLRQKADRKPLSLKDVHTLVTLASAPEEQGGMADPVLAMAIVLASLTGARRGELAGLQWEDVDAVGRCITIERQWVPQAKGGQYLADTKSFNRPVHLGVVGMALLERYGVVSGSAGTGWLLSEDGGATPVVARNLGRAITDLGKAAGIPVTTHSFRRVQATELVAAGVDVDTAARRMGHTTAVMLQDYVLGASDRSVAAADAIEARLVERGLPLDELLPVVAPKPAISPSRNTRGVSSRGLMPTVSPACPTA
jgi:integrase